MGEEEEGVAGAASAASAFALLSDDIVINILQKVEEDPRDWARAACVSARFSALVRDVCCRAKCSRSIPPDLLPVPASTSPEALPPPGGWAALHKLSVCCPGLIHAGVLLEHADFGLELDIGPDHNHLRLRPSSPRPIPNSSLSSPAAAAAAADCTWSLFDDLYFDTVYDVSESPIAAAAEATVHVPVPETSDSEQPAVRIGRQQAKKRKRHWDGPLGTHLDAGGGAWNPSRQRGSKLLANRFRGDSLYLGDLPGCVHVEGTRKYRLFRGVFKDFKRSCVWRSLGDGRRSKTGIGCAFCACRGTWDLHSAFCLRRIFGYHDDGEPEVRAYVCENGHVAGAWAERPVCT